MLCLLCLLCCVACSEDALRKRAEVEEKMGDLEAEERRRQAEAADLQRELDEARQLAQRAERRRWARPPLHRPVPAWGVPFGAALPLSVQLGWHLVGFPCLGRPESQTWLGQAVE